MINIQAFTTKIVGTHTNVCLSTTPTPSVINHWSKENNQFKYYFRTNVTVCMHVLIVCNIYQV